MRTALSPHHLPAGTYISNQHIFSCLDPEITLREEKEEMQGDAELISEDTNSAILPRTTRQWSLSVLHLSFTVMSSPRWYIKPLPPFSLPPILERHPILSSTIRLLFQTVQRDKIHEARRHRHPRPVHQQISVPPHAFPGTGMPATGTYAGLGSEHDRQDQTLWRPSSVWLMRSGTFGSATLFGLYMAMRVMRGGGSRADGVEMSGGEPDEDIGPRGVLAYPVPVRV